MRLRHWTIGRFPDWLRGTKFPMSASHEDWEKLHADAKAAHPFRYWLVESFIDRLQDVVYWPAEALSKARHYFRNRFVTKTHFIKTGLQKGVWHESEEQILHGMFGVLVEFVEVESAWMFAITNDGIRLPWFWQRFRSSELGLKRLDWEISLVDDEGNLTHQATAALETKRLYIWWTVERPKRQDPWTLVNEEAGEYHEKYGAQDALEKKHDDEDTEMLCRLVRIRHCLWT